MQAGGLFDQAGKRRRGAVRQSRPGPARGQIQRRDAAVQDFCLGIQGSFSHLGGLIDALTGSTAHRIPDPPGHLGHLSATHGWGGLRRNDMGRRHRAGLVRGFIIISFIMSKHRVAVSWRLTGRVRLLR